VKGHLESDVLSHKYNEGQQQKYDGKNNFFIQ
jgi:hypothetical protein